MRDDELNFFVRSRSVPSGTLRPEAIGLPVRRAAHGQLGGRPE